MTQKFTLIAELIPVALIILLGLTCSYLYPAAKEILLEQQDQHYIDRLHQDDLIYARNRK